jgi:hypothetical protein
MRSFANSLLTTTKAQSFVRQHAVLKFATCTLLEQMELFRINS